MHLTVSTELKYNSSVFHWRATEISETGRVFNLWALQYSGWVLFIKRWVYSFLKSYKGSKLEMLSTPSKFSLAHRTAPNVLAVHLYNIFNFVPITAYAPFATVFSLNLPPPPFTDYSCEHIKGISITTPRSNKARCVLNKLQCKK